MPQSFTSTAMVVTYGNGQLLFVDQDNGTPYIPGLDTAEIVGADGVTMAPEGLAAGNIVSVTGNGIMLESYPGRYPGITRIEVTETGNPEDANAYDELVAQIWQPADPAEPAYGTLEYTTDLAIAAFQSGVAYYRLDRMECEFHKLDIRRRHYYVALGRLKYRRHNAYGSLAKGRKFCRRRQVPD